MNEDDIKKWSNRYDVNYDEELQKIEERLTDELAEQQYITQEQLKAVVQWKLNAQRGRRDRFIEQLNSVPDEFI